MLSLFLIAFSLSGILLNHRGLISSLDLSRSLLPHSYHLEGWTQGAAVGSTLLGGDSILLYGGEGIWLTRDHGATFSRVMEGLPSGVDRYQMRRVVHTHRRGTFALSQSALYQWQGQKWQEVALPLEERLTDLAMQGDSLVVMGRSHLFVARLPYLQFSTLTLPPSPSVTPHRTTLFRTLWSLHSGELFHWIGRLFVDALGLIMLLLSVSGVLIFLFPRWMKHLQRRAQGAHRARSKQQTRRLQLHLKRKYQLHLRVGYWLFVPLLILTLTGMFLRPLLLVAVAKLRVPTLPTTSLHSVSNPWQDGLRRLVYVPSRQEWILSTSEGLFRCQRLGLPLEAIADAPPISVMGANVFEVVPDSPNMLLVGSFMGLFRWDLEQGSVVDVYTAKSPATPGFMPLGDHKVSGCSAHLGGGEGIAFEYDVPCRAISQPRELGEGRISLFQTMLELHTGRLYVFFGSLGILWIFVSGCMILWLLISGFGRARRQLRKRASRGRTYRSDKLNLYVFLPSYLQGKGRNFYLHIVTLFVPLKHEREQQR